MLTIKYKQHSGLIETWEDQLKAMVIAHQLVQDETIESPILTNESETVVGDIAISKYVDELAAYQEAWFACSCN
ncbi:MAG: hypothetical protein AB8G11_10555 [Saprospiraceae bacterium]